MRMLLGIYEERLKALPSVRFKIRDNIIHEREYPLFNADDSSNLS